MNATKSITAQDTLTITTHQRDLSTTANATADADGFAGNVSANATNTQRSKSNITAVDTTRVTARNLVVSANSDDAPQASTDASTPGFILLSGDSEEESTTLDQTRKIVFPAKIQLLGAEGPVLNVDATGKVLVKKNLTLNNNTIQVGQTVTSGEIVVDNIRNDNPYSAGRVDFQIPTTTSDFNIGGATATAKIEGRPEIVFLNTFDRVEIDNASARPIRVNNVNVRNPVSQFSQNIRVDVRDQSSFTPQIGNPISGNTLITIINKADADIILDGVIDNPTGTTSITNQLSSRLVLATGNSLIISGTMNLSAPRGAIGTAQNLLRSSAPVGGSQLINANANGPIFLSVTGDVGLGTITSTTDRVLLRASKSISDGSTASGANVTSNHITLEALEGSAGTSAKPIKIETMGNPNALNAQIERDFFVTETAGQGGLQLGNVRSNRGNIQIVVPDELAVGQDILLVNGNTVQAMEGSVTIHAGDNLQFDPTSTIRARTQVTLRADQGDDPNESLNLPTTVWLQGDVFSPLMLIETGPGQ